MKSNDALPKGVRKKGNAFYFDTKINGQRTWVPIHSPDDPRIALLRRASAGQRSGDNHMRFAKNMAAKIIGAAKHRAKKFNRSFDLTADQVIGMYRRCGGRCEVTGIPMEFKSKVTAENKPWRPSLDRIDSSKGYTLDNCRIVCHAVNVAMMNWGESVIEKIAFGLAQKRRKAEKCRRKQEDVEV